MDDENSQAEGSNVEGAVGYARNDVQNNLNNNNSNSNNNASQQQQQQQQNHPHYENIYESLEQYNAAAAAAVGAVAGANAIAPADELPPPPPPPQAQCEANANAAIPPQHNLNNLNNASNNANVNGNNNNKNPPRILPNISYRNDLYDRTNTTSPAYDIPRAVRSGLGFRRNFHIDLQGANRFNTMRAAATNAAPAAFYGGINTINANANSQRQRSFDDTESHNYYQPSLRYENIYEQIRDEPIYRNTAAAGNGAAARVYGRLDVIGHGIGRIERHLSSSCGNIDHYNLGGHYAVLGHSHFGTVGHIRLNASSSVANAPILSGPGTVVGGVAGGLGAGVGCGAMPQPTNAAINTMQAVGSNNQRDSNNVKNSASSFFSCLQGENAQSMNNVYRATAGVGNGGLTSAAAAAAAGPLGQQQLNMQLSSTTSNNTKERESRSASAGPLSMAAANNTTNNNNNGVNPSSDAATTSAGARQTGAIPKIKALALNANKASSSNGISSTAAEKANSIKNAITKKAINNINATQQTSAAAKLNSTSPENAANAGTLNRISKSSLQWLLVNKWLPLWIGQGPDCKVIDFNFMFSRDCGDSCNAAASAASHMSNPYYTPRLGGMMPHDLVRFSAAANADLHAPCAAAAAALRRDFNMRPRAINRLRETETLSRRGDTSKTSAHRYEDPSYENVHVHWQNGFEFGRSRDNEHSHNQTAAAAVTGTANRPQLQRARSESPSFSTQQRRMRSNASADEPSSSTSSGSNVSKYADPFKNYVLNAENNTFKPKVTAKVEIGGEGINESGVECSAAAENAMSYTTTQPTSAVTAQPNGIDEADEHEPPQDMNGAVGGREDIGGMLALGQANSAEEFEEKPNSNPNENKNMNDDNETDAIKTKSININNDHTKKNSTNNEQSEE